MKKLKNLLSITIGTLILSIIGLFNGYPLVYSDTGTYLYSGFSSFIPKDRPITYGLFIKFFSFSYSAWFVILIQNLITAFVIFELINLFIGKNYNFKRIYYGILLFLVLFTGIGWYSNQLMPDFFAPLTFLIIFIILKSRNIFSVSNLVLIAILVFSLISHFSHLLIGSTIIAGITLIKFFPGNRLQEISLNRILAVTVIVFSGWLVLPLVNYVVEKQFILSKGSHVFLMAHLNDTGILKKFLDENCKDEEFSDCKICNYKDELPVDLASFIWGQQSIVSKTGGWEESKDEYNKIINATLKRPKYLFMNFYKSFTYGLVQLTRNGIGQGLSAYNDGSAPYGQIHWRFNHELNNYLNSKQNKWDGQNLNFKLINLLQIAIIIASLFLLILLFTSQLFLQINSTSILFLIYTITAIIINSFVTAGLNSPCERFQARVIWLLPFALILLIVKNQTLIKNFLNSKKSSS